MNWVLVYIVLIAGEPQAKKIGEYDQMTGCFFARQKLLLEKSGASEHFPPGSQAICINTTDK